MTPTPLLIPGEIPVIVLSQTVLFPHSLLPLHIFEERYRKMVQSSLGNARIFGVIQESQQPGLPISDLAGIMGIGIIRACVERPEGTSDLILQGLARVRIVGESQSQPFRILQTEPFATEVTSVAQVTALAEKLREQGRILHIKGYRMPSQMDEYLETVKDPEIIGDLLAATFVENPFRRQEILETARLETRLELVLQEMQALS